MYYAFIFMFQIAQTKRVKISMYKLFKCKVKLAMRTH